MSLFMNFTKQMFLPTLMLNKNKMFFHNNTKLLSSIMYTNDHETIHINEDIIKIGLSVYAIQEMGEIVFIEPEFEEGDYVSKGETLCTIESVKSTEDITAICDGTIINYNNKLLSDYSQIKELTENKSWFVKLKLNENIQTTNFMNYEEYHKHIK